MTFEKVPREDFRDSHREFHTALIAPAASAWDLRLLRPSWEASDCYTRFVFDPVAEPEEFAARRAGVHEELVDAARSRDPERVREELRHRLEATMTTMLDRMSAVGSRGAGDHARGDRIAGSEPRRPGSSGPHDAPPAMIGVPAAWSAATDAGAGSYAGPEGPLAASSRRCPASS